MHSGAATVRHNNSKRTDGMRELLWFSASATQMMPPIDASKQMSSAVLSMPAHRARSSAAAWYALYPPDSLLCVCDR